MKQPVFHSEFAEHIEGFITHKRAVGYTYNTAAATLKRFDEFCIHYHGDQSDFSKELVMHWAERRRGETIGTLRIRVTAVRQFGLYMAALGHNAYVIPCAILPKYQRYTPYIFSEKELTNFFAQTDACQRWPGDPLRHMAMPVLFRLLYRCGLRVSEACRLKVEDIDLHAGIIAVYNGKFNKDRRVPMSEDLAQRGRDYSEYVHLSRDREVYFFQSCKGRPFTAQSVYGDFRKLLWAAGISHGGPGKGPRVHDFRHTFATHCLKRWVMEGKDLSAYLPVLKAYLGHTHFQETAYYLKLTADVFPSITAQIERFFGELIPQAGTSYENN